MIPMRCVAKNRNKKRCKANAIPGKRKCIFHGGRAEASAKKNNSLKKTKRSESRTSKFAKRQAIVRGSRWLSPSIQKAGYAMVAYGGAPRNPPKYIRSTLQKRHNVKHKGVDYKKPLRRTAFGHEQPHGPRYGYTTSTKTKVKSPAVRFGGRMVAGAGRMVPVLGVTWLVYDSVFGGDKTDAIVDDQIRGVSEGITRSGKSPSQSIIAVKRFLHIAAAVTAVVPSYYY